MANLASLKGVNYYPALNGWYYMWTHWNAATLDRDFGTIATELHANLVRLIIPADTYFGYPTPHPRCWRGSTRLSRSPSDMACE